MSNWFVHRYLQAQGQRPVGWTARGRDGVSASREDIRRRLEAGISPGSILLIHDGYDATARGYAPADIAGDLLEALDARGYRCVIPEPASWRC